jgi:hypothetical protein
LNFCTLGFGGPAGVTKQSESPASWRRLFACRFWAVLDRTDPI